MMTQRRYSISTGILVAATGVGAGDLVMAALAGAQFGTVLLWAVVVGAWLKYVLNEGLARWDVATGTTLLQGWIERLPKAVAWYFLAYLFFWGFLVAGTLISYTGVVANTIFPLPVSEAYGAAIWGGGQSLVVVALILWGGFAWVERVMKLFIGLMFCVVLYSAVVVWPGTTQVLTALFVPRTGGGAQSLLFVTALIGGVGGSLTLLCYSYWLREKEHATAPSLSAVRFDLRVAYLLTALFGMAVLIIAAGVSPEAVKGYGLVVSIADELGRIVGPFGRWVFLLGFWGAVLSSMIGVWNGVPYLFADFVQQYRARHTPAARVGSVSTRSGYYRFFLLYLAVLPVGLAIWGRPNWVGVAYAVAGAFFMPFLAAVLVYMNNRRDWVGELRNTWTNNGWLVLSLLLFLVLLVAKFL